MRKILLLTTLLFFSVHLLKAQQIQESALRQIASLQQDKESRTPAQQKINSQLLYAMKKESGRPITNMVSTLKVNVNRTADGKVPVEIKGNVTPALLQTIRAAGGVVVFSSVQFQSITANVPLANLEKIAALNEVRQIMPSMKPRLVGAKSTPNKLENTNTLLHTNAPLKIQATTFEERKASLKSQLTKALNGNFFIGSITSEGDVTHKAALARTTFGVNGAGIKIGVISDSYDAAGGAAANVASGDLPGVGNPNGFTTPVTVLQDDAGGTDEGRAMLNIVHDLAPGAQLYFATADIGGEPGFAQAILNLRAAGCSIICDDVAYFTEGVFQDGIIAQAVNTVTASGALYFSSAGNEGSKFKATSTVWEGDFVDGGTLPFLAGGTVNNFSTTATAALNNQIVSDGGLVALMWSDPLGKSSNDYDVFELDAALANVIFAGTDIQNGTQDPIEIYGTDGLAASDRIVILKKTGAAARALHLNNFNEGTTGLTFNTSGQTSGHSSAAAAFSVAATAATTNGFGGPNGPYPGSFVTTNKVQTFSSDGPRKIFYNADSTPVTPGNFLFKTAGGITRLKPDITAANGVSDATAGFSPFFGTSAAAPHAAAIAALIKQYIPAITPAQMRTLLTSTAIDIETAGYDSVSGSGIVMAFEALANSCKPGFATQPANVTACTGGTANFVSAVAGTVVPTFQWQVSTNNGTTWTDIAGATAANFSFATAIADNGKQYRVKAKGTCDSTYSNIATLTVVGTSVGGTLSPPTSSTCGAVLATGTLTLSGQVGNIVRWEQSTDGGTTWTTVTPANTSTTLAYNVTVTTMYRVIVQGTGCAAAAISATATVTFVPGGVPINIVADPGTTVCAGNPTRLTVITGGDVTQSSTTSITIPTTAAPANPYPSTLTVGGLPTSGATVKSVTITGLSHTFYADIDMLLQSPTGQNVVLMSDIGGANGVTNVNYTFMDGAPALVTGIANPSGTYKPTNNGATDTWVAPGPGSVTQANPTLATFTGNYNGVWKLFIVDDTNLDGGSITGGFSITFTSPAANVTTGTFAWTPAAGLSNTTTNPVAASPATTTTYTVSADDGAGCVRKASVLITVNQPPVVTTQPTNVTVCANGTVKFTGAATGTNVTYQWQESTNGGTSYSNIANGGVYSGVTTTTLTLTGVTVTMNNNRYRMVVNGITGCTVAANSTGAILTVAALPTVSVTPAYSCGGIAGTNGTLLTATGATAYTWSPIVGLFTDAAATVAYTGTPTTSTVYAAPSSLTNYTVTGTNGTTGCSAKAVAVINYTPNAPVINPAPANLCFSDSIIMLTKAQPQTLSFTSGAINVPIIDNTVVGGNNSIAVSGIPAGANITKVVVKMNATHTWAGDLVIGLKAPNNQVLNLDYGLSQTNNGTGILSPAFVNTLVSSAGGTSFGAGTQPFTGTFAADKIVVPTAALGNAPTGPTGFAATTNQWSNLYGTPNGNWTLAWADVFGGGDVGTFQDWSIDITYQVGSPSTAPVWTPIAGLYTNAAATIPYVANTPRDTVWVKVPSAPLPGTYTYQTVAQGIASNPSNTDTIKINSIGTASPYPSVLRVDGYPTTGVSVKSVVVKGLSHMWAGDIDMILQSPTGQNVILMSDVGDGATFNVPTITDVTYTFSDAGPPMVDGDVTNPTGTYHPTNFDISTDNWPAPGPGTASVFNPALAQFGSTANVNGDWKLLIVDDFAGDAGIITGGWSIEFDKTPAGCTSPTRAVTVTLNDSVKIVTQPSNASSCLNNPASFTVTAKGTGLTYQWQVSTDNGASFSNVTNGGVYAGATAATLTITAPPSSMNGYLYHVVVNGISPCGGKTSVNRTLSINSASSVVLSAAPYTKLLPGLVTVLSSTGPALGATYTWQKNGTTVPNATGSTLTIAGADAIGDYTIKVTDINGCTSTSAIISITDSASGKLFIYPNPNNGQFQVRYYSTLANTNIARGINVYDARGKRVLTQNYSVSAPYARMDVDLRSFGAGVYWLELVDFAGNRLAVGRVELLR